MQYTAPWTLPPSTADARHTKKDFLKKVPDSMLQLPGFSTQADIPQMRISEITLFWQNQTRRILRITLSFGSLVSDSLPSRHSVSAAHGRCFPGMAASRTLG